MTAPMISEGTSENTDVMQDIISASVTQTMHESDPTSVERDEKGRFVAKPTDEITPIAEQPDALHEVPLGDISTATDGDEVDDVPLVLPEGMVAVPKVERALATPFSIKDAEGDLEIPDLTITFNANGKERSEPLDKVVRLAQWGVFNQERDQAAQQAKVESQRVSAENAQLRQYAERLQREQEQLLSDDNLYLTKRAQHEQENTPEMRLQREREQLEQQQHRMEFDRAAQDGSRFFDTTVAPAVETITKALPLVSAEEIGAKLLLVANRFQVHTAFGSIIPPHQYKAVTDTLLAEVIPWAQQLQDHREQGRKSTEQKSAAEKLALQKAAEKAQADAQKKTSLLTRTAKPSQGRAAKEVPPPKPIRTVEDAMESVIADTLTAMR